MVKESPDDGMSTLRPPQCHERCLFFALLLLFVSLLLSSSSSVHIHPPCLHQEPAPSQTLVGTLTINLRLRIPVIMITGI